MFAGGGEELDWTLSVLFDAMGAMSSRYNETPARASRAFDANRNGFVIAGGAGVLVLEEYEQEIKEREKGKVEKADEAIADELLEIEKKRNEKAAAKVGNTSNTAAKNTNKKQTSGAKAKTPATKQQQPLQKQAPAQKSKQQKPAANANKTAKKDAALPIEKDHFTKDEVSSSNSDESWEKDFEVDEK